MAYLVDTNVMWRSIAANDPRHDIVRPAVDSLIMQGEALFVTAQNLIEFQALATRPTGANGLGISTREADELASEMEAMYSFLPEAPAIYTVWRELIRRYDVTGRQVYDARLVAVMLAYDVSHILTLNASDFRRFAEITVVEPSDVS